MNRFICAQSLPRQQLSTPNVSLDGNRFMPHTSWRASAAILMPSNVIVVFDTRNPAEAINRRRGPRRQQPQPPAYAVNLTTLACRVSHVMHLRAVSPRIGLAMQPKQLLQASQDVTKKMRKRQNLHVSPCSQAHNPLSSNPFKQSHSPQRAVQLPTHHAKVFETKYWFRK
jgi:hypothetical protein